MIVAAFLSGRPGAIEGMTTLLLFAIFALLTALSVLWSISPELTWIETNSMFAYLAVFAAGRRRAPVPRGLRRCSCEGC